jgi:glycosyltransferase involved in cell wall biosynthesis
VYGRERIETQSDTRSVHHCSDHANASAPRIPGDALCHAWAPLLNRAVEAGAASRVYRLAVLNTHPIQYFAPLYAHLARDPALEVTVLYCSDVSLRGAHDPGFGREVRWDIDLLTGYRSVFLGEHAARRRTPAGFWSLVCPQVVTELWSGRYDALLLHGYNFAVNLLAFTVAKMRGLAVFMRSDAHMDLARKRWKRRLRNAVLRFGYRYLDGFLAIGSANRAYYRSLGVPDAKIFDVPFAVDNARWMQVSASSPEIRLATRRKYGLRDDAVVVLFAAKFTARKKPDDVLRAAGMLRERGVEVDVFMVGSGELESELRALASALGLQRVIFPGFVNQSALPEVYAASDIFVLPSQNEPWALTVNEVMCAGLPVIVTEEVGCAPDLVRNGVNGYRYPAGDVQALASHLESLATDTVARRRMGEASRQLIGDWSFDRCSAGLKRALQACVTRLA